MEDPRVGLEEKQSPPRLPFSPPPFAPSSSSSSSTGPRFVFNMPVRDEAPSPMTVLSNQVHSVSFSDESTTPPKRSPLSGPSQTRSEEKDKDKEPQIKLAMRQLFYTQPRTLHPGARARMSPSPSMERGRSHHLLGHDASQRPRSQPHFAEHGRRSSAPSPSPVQLSFSCSSSDFARWNGSSQDMDAAAGVSAMPPLMQQSNPLLDPENENDSEILRLIFESQDGRSVPDMHSTSSLDAEALERSPSSQSIPIGIRTPSRPGSQNSHFAEEDDFGHFSSNHHQQHHHLHIPQSSLATRRLATSPLKGAPDLKKQRSATSHDERAFKPFQAEQRKLQRSKSMPFVQTIDAVLNCPKDVPANGIGIPCTLPTIKGDRQEINWVSDETVVRILQGEFKEHVDQYIIVDCRYPYEYDGGHIQGAINLYLPEQVQNYFFYEHQPRNDRRLAVIFHCEFSSKRAPALHTHLRAIDRAVNRYPALYYPDIYVLSKGYKEFHEKNKAFCTPSEYVTMDSNKGECRRFTAELSRAWKRKSISESARVLIGDANSCVGDPTAVDEEELAAMASGRLLTSPSSMLMALREEEDGGMCVSRMSSMSQASVFSLDEEDEQQQLEQAGVSEDPIALHAITAPEP